MTPCAIIGVAWASTIITASSPTMTPELGSPSAVKAKSPGPTSSKDTFFSAMSPVEANPVALIPIPFALRAVGSQQPELSRVATHLLIDRAKDRMAVGIAHLDADPIAELQIRRLRCAETD